MKTAYILALVVILAVLVVAWVNTRPETPVTPTTDRTETPTHTMPTSDDMGMTPEEHATMTDDSTDGNDVGMEFPDTNLGASGAMSIDPNAKVFDVGGQNFGFNMKEIKVRQGDTVVINFTSTGGFHDWVVDEFNARTSRVNTGETSSVTFVADKVGTFEYYCSVGQHRANGMVGRLIIE
jgi:plastocyanin